MKKLNEVIPNLSTKFTEESGKGPASNRPGIVWAQLGEMFGKSFYREYGSSPPDLWVQAISRLSDHELSAGLKNLAEDSLQFPANLGQFVEACRRTKPVRFLGVKDRLEDMRIPGTMSRMEWMRKSEETE